MKLFSLDINIIATAYVRAETPEEAQELVRQHLVNTGMHLPDDHEPFSDEICIDGGPYKKTILRTEPISLSPSMTLVGPVDSNINVEEVEL